MNSNPLKSTTRSVRPVSRYGAIALATFTAAVLSTTAAAAAAVVITVSPSDNYVAEMGTSRGEIAGHYGAPPGFGRTAAELDTVADPDPLATNWAGIFLQSGGENPALPVELPFAELSALSIWAYRDSNSLDETLPAFKIGLQSAVPIYLELHARDNPTLAIQDNTWTQLDLTSGGDALWSMDTGWADLLFPGQDKDVATLAEIATAIDTKYGSGTRIDSVFLTQGDYPATVYDSLFTAFDGFRIAAGQYDLTFDFESGVTSKDDCKHGGWSTITSGGPWKNQGECIAAFLTAD